MNWKLRLGFPPEPETESRILKQVWNTIWQCLEFTDTYFRLVRVSRVFESVPAPSRSILWVTSSQALQCTIVGNQDGGGPNLQELEVGEN